MISDKNGGEEGLDLGLALGAEDSFSNQCFTVYIPNKDREGNEIGRA